MMEYGELIEWLMLWNFKIKQTNKSSNILMLRVMAVIAWVADEQI